MPTALAAVSGSRLEEVGRALQVAAGLPSPELLRGYNINHWLEAINHLGGGWELMVDFSDAPLVDPPTIPGWMSRNSDPHLKLVFCVNGGPESHVFSAKAHQWVDPVTRGKCEPFSGIPDELQSYTVKRVFRVFANA